MGLFFNQPDWMQYHEPSARDCWFLGAIPEQANRTPEDRPNAVAFAESGYFIMRSGDNPDSVQLVFDCGTHGGGHGHWDMLNFDLYGFGRPLIADPGRLVYDESPDRMWLLSTPAHNTISLDGQNHAPFERDQADRIHLRTWDDSTNYVLVSGWHEGYQHLAGAPLVGRTIWFDKRNVFVIADWMASDAQHDATVSFILPGTQLESLHDSGMRTTQERGNVLVSPILQAGQSCAQEPKFYSPNYGVREPAVRFAVTGRGSRMVFVTVIQTFDVASPTLAPAVSNVRVLDGEVYFLREGDGDIRLKAPFA